MPAEIERESGSVYVLHLRGMVRRDEFAAVQNVAASDIAAGVKPRILAVLENFEGWERGADWGELDLLFAHGHEIEKIAIVGDPDWGREALAFAGSGQRRAPVRFFPTTQLTQARAWLG